MYTYKNFFKLVYKENPLHMACTVKNTAEFYTWSMTLQEKLTDLLGLHVLREAEITHLSENLCAELLATEKESGYMRYKLKIRTLPEVWMPFYMLVPDGILRNEPSKAIIAIPAHGASKDTVAGVLTCPEVREKLNATPKENYGQEFVRKGYIVFVPDPPGYGERQEPLSAEDQSFLGEIPYNPLGSTCKNLTMTAEALGTSFAGLVLWDMKKLVDFIETLPFVDNNRLGCCGFSGGGLYSLWLAAMDDRIKLAIISGYLHGYCNSILDTHLCPCNFVPDLWKHCDISDIASLIAPRPLFFENGTDDVLNGRNGLNDHSMQYEKIQRIYGLFGHDEWVSHGIFHGPHMWNGLGYEFAEKFL